MNDFKNLDQFYIYKGKVFLIGDLSSRTPMLETLDYARNVRLCSKR